MIIKVIAEFWPEDGGEKFFRNVDLISKEHTALYPRREQISSFLARTLSKNKTASISVP